MVRELLTGFTPFTLFSLRNSVWAWLKARATRRTDNQEFFDIERMEVADMETTMLSWAEQLEEFGLKKGLALVENAREEAKGQGKEQGKSATW